MANTVLQAILQEARRRHAPPKLVKAAVETGIVESGLRNLPYGDADSMGWRQERASIYKNPLNLRASVKRFFDEAEQLDHPGISAGELAARVQRPAAQYRGRYNQVSGRASTLIRRAGHGETFGQSDSTFAAPTGLRTTTQFDRAGYEQDRKRFVVAQLLSRNSDISNNPLFASGLLSLEAPNPQDYTRKLTETVAGSGRTFTGLSGRNGTARRHPPKELFELFYKNQAFKYGQPIDPVAGHDTHVHVAAGPNQVDALGRLAQKLGLNVGENATFGPVHRVHVDNSFHYKNEAIDVSGQAALLRKFMRKVERRYGLR